MHYQDILILYTDGITEAENVDKELYGIQRLKNIITLHRQQNVETIKEKVTQTTIDEATGEEKTTTKMVPKKISKEVEYEHTSLIDTIGAEDEFYEFFTIQSTARKGAEILEKCDDLDCNIERKKSSDCVIVIGEDCITHPNSANIAKLVGLIEKYTVFKVLIIPTQTNTLGVSLLCDLDLIATGKTVGYNMKADFELSALGDGDIDMPVLSQQEGTFTNINKKVVPTNGAIAYNGYELNDIANEILDITMKNTIDYTKEIFNNIAFDDLENYYSNDRVEHRGYSLETKLVSTNDESLSKEQNSLKLEENEYIIYNANPINQFNEFTAVANQLKDDIVALYISKEFAQKLELEETNQVELTANNTTMTLDVRVDNDLIGEISYVPTFDKRIDTKELFKNSRFSIANLRKV